MAEIIAYALVAAGWVLDALALVFLALVFISLLIHALRGGKFTP